MHTSHHRPWTRCLYFVLAGALLAGCGAGSEAKQTEPGDVAPRAEVVVPVEVVQPVRGNISSYFETTARVEAERRVALAAEGSGRCVSIAVEEGDSVEAGQILAELKKDEAQALLRQAQVNVQQTKTAYDLAVKQSQAGHGTQVDRDNTRFAYEQALAELEMRQIVLENLSIRAPIDGIVTKREIQIGALVNSGTTAFEIVDPDSLMLAIHPPEKQIPRLTPGQSAQVRIDAMPGRVFQAQIRRISPSVDPASGTVKVILDFDARDRRSIPESAFARVQLVMDTRQNVLLIPKDAVLEEDGKSFVYAIREVAAPDETNMLRAERVEVGLGLEDSARVQVFRGLADDDRVVVNGHYSLKPDSAVSIMDLDAELEATAGLSAEQALAEAEARREELSELGETGQGGQTRQRW